MKKYSLTFYWLLFIGTFLCDRFTKYWATTQLESRYSVNSFCSFELVYNRGVTWSFFDSANPVLFFLLSMVIALIILGVAFYTYIRWMNHYTIVGETLVIAGALSNLIDRAWYGGVVDFIHLHCNGWSWPIFNIADVAIIGGVIIMFFINYLYE